MALFMPTVAIFVSAPLDNFFFDVTVFLLFFRAFAYQRLLTTTERAVFDSSWANRND
jgi:hypothetical protein